MRELKRIMKNKKQSMIFPTQVRRISRETSIKKLTEQL